MIGLLRDISVTCFLSSYIVVLALELLRLAGRMPGRAMLVIVMMVVGIFTHVTFLTLGIGHTVGQHGLLATWTDWSLLVSLGLAICFLVVYLRRPETVVSFFFVPAILAMIGLSLMVRDQPAFSRTQATEIWRTIHGLSMMFGSGIVLVGFLAGAMYLVQSWRLKNHRAGSDLKLPTLETLMRWNCAALWSGTVAVGIGLVAGVVMNLNRWGYVGWDDRGVLFSIALFIWLLLATLVDLFYTSFGSGRKAVYLTLVSGGFLALALAGVLTTPHRSDATLSPRFKPSANAPVAEWHGTPR